MPKAGDKCKDCGIILHEVKPITSPGCKHADTTFLACRCLHGGDYFCNCGKPCWSFF